MHNDRHTYEELYHTPFCSVSQADEERGDWGVDIMNVGTAHSEVNPNTRVMNSRGIWLSYLLGIGLLHVILLSIPFASVPVVWTLTNLIHNLVGSRHLSRLCLGAPVHLTDCIT